MMNEQVIQYTLYIASCIHEIVFANLDDILCSLDNDTMRPIHYFCLSGKFKFGERFTNIKY